MQHAHAAIVADSADELWLKWAGKLGIESLGFSIQAEHDDGVTKMLFNPFDGIQKILLYFLPDCENAASKIQMK